MPNDPAETGVSVVTQVAPSTATLGDLLQLDVRVKHPAAFLVAPPQFPKTLGNFEVVSSSPAPATVDGSFVTDHFTAELQNFSTGVQLLPPIPLHYRDLEQKEHPLATAPAQVTIHEVQAGPKDKGDIRGIVGVIGPVAWSPWWWLVALVAVAAAGAYAFARRKKRIQGPPPPPPVPADEWALRRLQELHATGWIETGKIKEFYSGLSEIIRGYLESGFGILALERTTNELMRELRKRGAFDPMLHIELKELLEACDLVKFAKLRPTPEEALSAYGAANQFVEKTRHALRQP